MVARIFITEISGNGLKKFRIVFQLVFGAMFNARVLAIWVILCAVAVAASPFGTFSSMPFSQRLVYWVSVVTVSFVLGFCGHALAVIAGRRWDAAGRFFLEGLFATLLISAAVWGIGRLPYFAESGGRLSYRLALAYVLLVTIAVVGIRAIVMQTFGVPSRAAQRFRPRLAERLSDGMGTWILSLSVTDHSVCVSTDRGQEVIRMRLTDAIGEMEGVEGFRVHRSHWVARDAIRGHDAAQGRVFLELVNGARVPVSRTYRGALEEAGVL